jgi:hypothetical protein
LNYFLFKPELAVCETALEHVLAEMNVSMVSQQIEVDLGFVTAT